MWDLAVREEDYDAIDAMLSRFAKAPLSMRLLPAFARGDSATRARFIQEATVSDSRQSQISARYVATFREDFATAESIARLDLAERRRPPIRLGAQLFLAWLDVARGQWTTANTEFENAKRMEGASAVELERAIAATLPFLEVPRADLEMIRSEIERSDSSSTPPPASGGLNARLRPHLRLYLLSLLSSRLGDGAAAARFAAVLDSLPAPAEASAVCRGLLRTALADIALRNGRPAEASAVCRGLLRTALADIALRNGRPAEALSMLEPVQGEIPLELVYLKPFATVREYGQEHARYLRAESLFALRRYDEALRWYQTSFQGSPAELVYLAPSHLRQAEIFAARGETEKAKTHYRRFLALWREPDSALQATVNDARRRLDGLADKGR